MHLGKWWVIHTCITVAAEAQYEAESVTSQNSWFTFLFAPVCIWTWRKNERLVTGSYIFAYSKRGRTVFSGSTGVLFGYFKSSAVFEVIRWKIKSMLKECYTAHLHFFFFLGMYGTLWDCLLQKKRVPSYFHSYWLSIICWKSVIRPLKSIRFSGVASQHLLIRLYNCQNTKDYNQTQALERSPYLLFNHLTLHYHKTNVWFCNS